ncbi:MAG: L,D-transpeptidase family protein [Pseudomonadota bacterium]|nr:L,D-transpeptidase family protein [Pseudomonadota bacterium]
MDLVVKPNGIASYGDRTYRCAIGRGGVVREKTEGDEASPMGRYRLIRALYRADRMGPPKTHLPLSPIAETDGWCDDPADTAYNTQVTLPHPASCEKLARDDRLYNIIVVTDHNNDPVVPGAGSAIFVHVADGADYAPTEGCIAFSETDLREILGQWVPGDDRFVIGVA